METQAKHFLLQGLRQKKIKLLWSYVGALDFCCVPFKLRLNWSPRRHEWDFPHYKACPPHICTATTWFPLDAAWHLFQVCLDNSLFDFNMHNIKCTNPAAVDQLKKIQIKEEADPCHTPQKVALLVLCIQMEIPSRNTKVAKNCCRVILSSSWWNCIQVILCLHLLRKRWTKRYTDINNINLISDVKYLNFPMAWCWTQIAIIKLCAIMF